MDADGALSGFARECAESALPKEVDLLMINGDLVRVKTSSTAKSGKTPAKFDLGYGNRFSQSDVTKSEFAGVRAAVNASTPGPRSEPCCREQLIMFSLQH